MGECVAYRAHAAGITTVSVEGQPIGGECSYWACELSKALLRPVPARADARRVPGLGDAADGPLDVAAVLAHRDDMASHRDDVNQVEWLRAVSVDLLRGHGRLDGPKRVSVRTSEGDTVLLTAHHAVALCTGSTPPRHIHPPGARLRTGATHLPPSHPRFIGGSEGVLP
ncbi:hypothetical protein [Streptomyces sp. NPDC058964]|uniref:hypothetical protein n=1 Tax=Streptomyces sp. NPDC058964 TaxID=3346681 RepID=UPI0036C337D0